MKRKFKAIVKYELYPGTAIRCSNCGKVIEEYVYNVYESDDKYSAELGFGNLIAKLCENCVQIVNLSIETIN
jgi:uncharacterized OB-fold protein